MGVLIRCILGLVIISLELGVLGRYGLTGTTVSLSIVSAWAFTWFTDRGTALSWAIYLGLLHDLISFLPFGTWTVTFLLVVSLADFLKSRFFEVSSVPLSLLTLAASSLLASLALAVVGRNFDLWAISGSTIANVLIGLVLYYALAFRFRFWGRWMGRRL